MQRKYFLSTTSRNSYETSSKNKYKLHKILKTEPSVASFATDESKLVQTKEIKRILEARSLPKKENIYVEMKKDDTNSIRYEKSLYDLKRQPNKSFINESYERKDVKMLQQWIIEMIQQAKEINESLPIQSYYADLTCIYSGAISELSRQISIHSKDQSRLVTQIWEDNLKMVQKILKEMEEHNVKTDMNSLGEIRRIHESYSRYMEKIKENQKQSQIQKDQLVEKMGILRRENDYLRRKEIRRETEINKLIKQHEMLIAKNKELSAELKYLIDYQKQQEILSHTRTLRNLPTEKYQLPQGLKRLSFISQAEELVQQINRVDEDDLEEEEALRKQNQINIQNYDQIIFQDKCIDTSDLAPMVDAECDTSAFIKYSNKEVQAVKIILHTTQEIQVKVYQKDQETQSDFKIIDQSQSLIPRIEKTQSYANYIEYANQYSMREFLNILPPLCFPSKAIQVKDILENQSLLQYSNFNQIFIYLSHIHALTQEDILELYHYNCQVLEEFLTFFSCAWEQIDQYIVRFQEKAILAYELELDIKNQTENIAYFENLYKLVAKKYFQIKKIKNIKQSTLKPSQSPQVIRSISPDKKKSFNFDQTESNKKKRQTLMVPQIKSLGLLQVPSNRASPRNIRSPINLQISESSDSSNSSITELESVQSEENLKMELHLLKPTVIFDKRFRIQNIQSKHAGVAILVMRNALKQIYKKEFGEIQLDKMVLKQLNQFICTYLKRVNISLINGINVPFFVHVYEQFFHQGGMQALASAKFARFIRSLSYHSKQNQKIKFYYQFITGEYDAKTFNFFLEILKQLDEQGLNGLSLFTGEEVVITNFKPLFKLLSEYHVSVNELSSNLEQLCMHLIQSFQKKREAQLYYLKEIFETLDVDNRKYIGYEEFKLFLLILKRKFLKGNKIAKFFHQEADYLEKGKKYMSSIRFIQICEEYNLLLEEEYLDLLLNDNYNERQIKLRLIKSQSYSQALRKLCCKDETKLRRKIFELAGEWGILNYQMQEMGLPQEFELISQKTEQMIIKQYSKDGQ